MRSYLIKSADMDRIRSILAEIRSALMDHDISRALGALQQLASMLQKVSSPATIGCHRTAGGSK
jgi:hypothetical protein